ncbi:uncharacterized protein MONBRDRAFT_32367 [Monosiga brevicollis MX1]|uniref:Aminotransferase class I/classII large domain-containing protein n=1 Tax=Monosiga brevicollis TaxID=81824 RepID=A9UZ37_MONBE|nr:uncharacterized protein MONBRDRAFT_32367 [Monosiga brevicollis MX1]EDQ89565.1 predicted protein [Monosiga brevicollis MX1]|eukprot:XP_001745594.1 hypothetical protein [Monosiga brevicollis MX1]
MCKQDPDTSKLNLGVGAFRDDAGKPHVMTIVKEVEEEMAREVAADTLNHEYPPMGGSQDLVMAAARLALGNDSSRIAHEHVTGVQALSGTGALRLNGEFLNLFHANKTIYIPDPTWGNHKPIFAESGLNVKTYRYFDEGTLGLDITGLLEDLAAAPKESIILLHAVAHNPTGVDPTEEQWGMIADAIVANDHLAVFDCAYLGFVSGDIDTDAMAMRLFANRGLSFFICMSFSKNFGIYSERCGVTLYVGANPDEADAVVSQLKVIGRPMWSVPPMHGAHIVQRILLDEGRTAKWRYELKEQARRILRMRRELYEGLKARDPAHNWDHIINQSGMFTFTGLSKEQCDELIQVHHVYLLDNGRINVSGIPADRVDDLVDAICAVVQPAPDAVSVCSLDMDSEESPSASVSD